MHLLRNRRWRLAMELPENQGLVTYLSLLAAKLTFLGSEDGTKRMPFFYQVYFDYPISRRILVRGSCEGLRVSRCVHRP